MKINKKLRKKALKRIIRRLTQRAERAVKNSPFLYYVHSLLEDLEYWEDRLRDLTLGRT